MHSNRCEHIDKQQKEKAKASHHWCTINQSLRNCLNLHTVEHKVQTLVIEQSYDPQYSCNSNKCTDRTRFWDAQSDQKAGCQDQNSEIELVPAILKVLLWRLSNYLDQRLDAEQHEKTSIDHQQDLLLLLSYHKIEVCLLHSVYNNRDQNESNETLSLNQVWAELADRAPATFVDFKALYRRLFEGLEKNGHVVSLFWV